MKVKRPALVIALIISILAGVLSFVKINHAVEQASITVNVLVPKSNIEAYSVITADNLNTIAVPPSIKDDYTVQEAQQVIGKITTAPLYAGKPIDLRTIVENNKSANQSDEQVVGVFIDAARCAGVIDGDLVDVYRISPQSQGEAAPRITANSRVLRITDEKGTPVRGASAVLQGATETINLVKNPRIVYLLVKPDEVPYVIQGSSDKTYLALAKKSKETKELPLESNNEP